MDKKRVTALALAILLFFLLAGVAWAGSTNGTVIDWFVLGSGGSPAESSSGNVTLNGTLGQTAIGSSAAIQGELGAGFWYGLGEGESIVYLPLLLRNP